MAKATFQKLAFGSSCVSFSALNIVILFSTAHQGFKIDKLIYALVGMLVCVLVGNIMNSINAQTILPALKRPGRLKMKITGALHHAVLPVKCGVFR